jgi:hypothetical protein
MRTASAARTVVSDDGQAIRLTVYNAAGTVGQVKLARFAPSCSRCGCSMRRCQGWKSDDARRDGLLVVHRPSYAASWRLARLYVEKDGIKPPM